MEKEQLRQQGIAQMKRLAEQGKKKQQKEAKILSLFFASKLWKEATVVGMVRSTNFEFNTAPIMQRALQEGKIPVMPKSLSGRQLAFYQVDEQTTYQTTKFGVEEPVSQDYVSKDEIDLLIVPGIIFTSEGYRIGFGGGFYDRYLSDFAGKTCSLVFSEQLNNDWEPFMFDQAVQRIYTDQVKDVIERA
jgi:5,10-methenyltetrahydrofolate synthetase